MIEQRSTQQSVWYYDSTGAKSDKGSQKPGKSPFT